MRNKGRLSGSPGPALPLLALWLGCGGICLAREGEAPSRAVPRALPGFAAKTTGGTDWPTTFHDPLLTGFSPLPCGMRAAPSLTATIHPGGQARYAVFLELPLGAAQAPEAEPSPQAERRRVLIVQDAQLRWIDLPGATGPGGERWSIAATTFLGCERLGGDERRTVLALNGNQLLLVDPATGAVLWSRAFEGFIDRDKVRLGRLLADGPGLQLAVFPQYATEGFLFAFAGGEAGLEPSLVWKTEEAKIDNWPPRADHGVVTLLEPDGSVIWNLRHHSINTHDPRTGARERHFTFQSGGQLRRNYGPSVIGKGRDGSPVLAIASQSVEHHLTCFTRTREVPPKLIHDRSLGYVYDADRLGSRLAVEADGLGDADGDGALDVVYSLRDASPGTAPRSSVVVCDVGSGEERSIPQVWLAGLADLDGDGAKELLVYSDSGSRMPDRGLLEVYASGGGGAPRRLGSVEGVQLLRRALAPSEQPPTAAWCQLEARGALECVLSGTRAVLLRNLETGSTERLSLREGALRREGFAALPPGSELLACVGEASGVLVALLLADGSLEVHRVEPDLSSRRILGPLRLTGGGPSPLVSAADLDGEPGAEVLVLGPRPRVQVYKSSQGGEPRLLWSAPFEGAISRLAAPARDLDGDGRPDVLTPIARADGQLGLRLLDGAGRPLWDAPLPVPSSGEVFQWTIGDFLGPGKAGVFVSARQGRAVETSLLVEGKTGRIVWTGVARTMPDGQTRPLSPAGLPVAYDHDGDGAEDLVLDYLDFIAVLSGLTGEPLFGPVSTPTVPGAWKLAYNSFIPVTLAKDPRPDFLVALGHGGIGLLAPDFHTERWAYKPDYDTPAKVAIADVDGDGALEAGYEDLRGKAFVCADLATGAERWRVTLASVGHGPAISADLDGDGRGEFLLGDLAIGVRRGGDSDTGGRGPGEILWRLGASATGWTSIADVDGDGQGELIVPGGDGLVRVFSGER